MAQSSVANISPTAYSPAWLREGSDIPYADEISRIIGAKKITTGLVGGEEFLPLMRRGFKSWVELRFRSLDNAIARFNCWNLIELAAGFSSRGISFTHPAHSARYLAIDLYHMSQYASSVLTRFRHPSPNFCFAAMDLTRKMDRAFEERFFWNGLPPAAVVCEGVLAYFDHDELRMCCENVRRMLSRTGGSWSTSDIHTIEEMRLTFEISKSYIHNFQEKVGRQFEDGCWESLDEAKAFYNECGFSVRRLEQYDFCPLYGLRSQISDDERVLSMLLQQQLWILTPRK